MYPPVNPRSYEIKDITPPAGIVTAMALQAEAERRKRASILESEGQRQGKINVAEGDKQQVILNAQADAEAIRQRCAVGADMWAPACLVSLSAETATTSACPCGRLGPRAA